jgi:hypothetical protein
MGISRMCDIWRTSIYVDAVNTDVDHSCHVKCQNVHETQTVLGM